MARSVNWGCTVGIFTRGGIIRRWLWLFFSKNYWSICFKKDLFSLAVFCEIPSYAVSAWLFNLFLTVIQPGLMRVRKKTKTENKLISRQIIVVSKEMCMPCFGCFVVFSRKQLLWQNFLFFNFTPGRGSVQLYWGHWLSFLEVYLSAAFNTMFVFL